MRVFLADTGLKRPRHIANTLWSFSQLQRSEQPLLELVAAVALETMDSFEPQSLASTMWAMAAMAKLSFSDPKLWSALSERSVELILEFDARGLSNTVWGCATMRRHEQQLLEALGRAAVPKLSEFDEQALSTTMWASAKLTIRNQTNQMLIDAIVLELLNRDASLHQQGLANISWSCATLRIGDPALLSALAG